MSRPMIAVLAEDDTDCKAIREIIRRVLGMQTKTKTWSSNGCSHLRRKLAVRLKVMANQGCNAFVVIHDLDRDPNNGSLNNEKQLRKTLEGASLKTPNTHICIPVEELEAWFWSDPDIIKSIGKGKGSAKGNPHLMSRPKEALIRLSIGGNRKPRYSTNDNIRLAKRLNLDICRERCPSFKDLLEFLHKI